MTPLALDGLLPAAVSDTLLAGIVGYCVADGEGRVLRREGALSQWAPQTGEALFDADVIASLREPVFALRDSGADMVIPGIGFHAPAGDFKLDIRFVWLEQGRYLLVTSTQAAARAEFEMLAAQTRRERQVLEEQLRARELRLVDERRLMALFIAEAPAAIAMLDKAARYVAVSERWRGDFGLSEDDTRTGAALETSLPFVSALWRKGIADTLNGAEVACSLDKVTGAHGRTDWLRWRFLPWQMTAALDGGTPEGGVLLFCETITETVEQGRKLEEQARRLRSANVDMKNFSLALSHDLQAPLRQMVKFAGLLDDDSGASLAGSGREFLNEIHAAGARMQRMIEALLRYLRIAARQPALRLTSLGEAVAAARENLRPDIAAARAVIDAQDLPQVMGDGELLTLLFQNLLQNSLKYAGAAAPVIRICAGSAGAVWHVVFEDNGPGIPPGLAAKAFDMFQRLDDRPGIAGAGVGLAVCRWIAGVHAGSIRIEPPRAAGLRIVITLPAVRQISSAALA